MRSRESGFVMIQVIVAIGLLVLALLVTHKTISIYKHRIAYQASDLYKDHALESFVQYAFGFIRQEDYKMQHGIFRLDAPVVLGQDISRYHCLIVDEEGKINVNAFWDKDQKRRDSGCSKAIS